MSTVSLWRVSFDGNDGYTFPAFTHAADAQAWLEWRARETGNPSRHYCVVPDIHRGGVGAMSPVLLPPGWEDNGKGTIQSGNYDTHNEYGEIAP